MKLLTCDALRGTIVCKHAPVLYALLYAVIICIASTALSTKPVPVTLLSTIFDIIECDCAILVQKQ